MALKLKHKRLKYRNRPSIFKVISDLNDDRLGTVLLTAYNAFHIEYLMNSYAFELIRLRLTDYIIIISKQYYDYVFEIRETCPHIDQFDLF